MNSIHPSTNFIGATGNFPIYDFIDNTSNILSNYTRITSNNLHDYIYNLSNEISPVLFDLRDFQHSRNDKIMYKDYDNNNNVVIVETDSNAEILFKNFNGDVKTKIDKNGDIYVYHPLEILPAGYSSGWWGVENRIAEAITLTQGLRFDVTNLQADALLIWSAVGTAQTTADLGVANALTAQGTANTALFNAGVAQLTANTALANAGIADGVATGALGLATTAQATATEAVAATLVINGILPNLISSNTLTNVLSPYISNKGGAIGGKLQFIGGKITIGVPQDATTITNGVDTYTLNPNSKLDVISNAYFAGNVGFGVTNPSYRLHFGNPFNGPNGYQLSIDNDNYPRTGYRIANIYNGQEISALKFINDINNNGGSACTFWTRNPTTHLYDPRLTIDATGEATFTENVKAKNFIGNIEFSTLKNNPVKVKRIFLDRTNFIYNSTKKLYTYDLDLTLHLDYMTIVINEFIPTPAKFRVFKIITLMSFDFGHLNEMNASDAWRDICYPEEYTIYMNNLQRPSGDFGGYNYWQWTPTYGDDYCSSLIIGKQNPNTVNGYWNTVPTNFNKLRFTSKGDQNLYVVITPVFTENYTEVLI